MDIRMIGKSILHYKIIEKLGEGGMGIVYKARDTNLDRFVAIKFLPHHIAANSNERKRFEIEAKAAAALNNNNIATVHAIEKSDDEIFIVMEYIEGKELKEEIINNPLSIDNAINYAIQIAEGLQAAHEKGIVHRDIKSSNIMVTGKGKIKIMDFGLAKFRGSAQITQMGTTVGTAAYMSPEQARGEEADQKADVWSFGVVLFEMLSGQLPFNGDYDQAVIYAILNEQPKPVQSLVTDIPSILIHILDRTLDKDSDLRYQSITDVLIELKRLKSGGSSSTLRSQHGIPVAPAIGKRKGKKGIIAIAAFLLVLILTIIFNPFNKADELPPLKKINFTSYPGLEDMPVFSKDGKSIAFVWNGANQDNFDIYIKLIGAGSPLRLTSNPAYDTDPAWSPDGRYIAFRRAGKNGSSYYIVPSLGGDERKIADVKNVVWGGLDWSPDGKELAVAASDSSGLDCIMLISVDTGEKQILTFPAGNNSWGDFKPNFSPDGSEIAFIRLHSLPYVKEIYLVPSTGGKEKQLTFDQYNIDSEAWTADGNEIVFSSNRSGSRSLWRVPAEGGSVKFVTGTGDGALNINIAKEGNALVYTHSTNNINIWRLDLAGSDPGEQSPAKFITSTQVQYEPQYSPDGKYIAFTSDRSGSTEIWRCNMDGSNPVQLTFFEGPSPGTPRWSPDGQSISFDCPAKGNEDIYIINSGGGKPRQITFSKFYDAIASWSADGKWIYFNSRRTGINQIWKIPSNGGEAVQVTKKGGFAAFELYDGRYIYFIKEFGNSRIFRVPVSGGGEEAVNDKILNNLNWGGWLLRNKGIYFAQIDSNGLGHISFYDFESEKAESIFVTPKPIWPWSGKIDISPDGRTLLFVQIDQVNSDIILTQNFR